MKHEQIASVRDYRRCGLREAVERELEGVLSSNPPPSMVEAEQREKSMRAVASVVLGLLLVAMEPMPAHAQNASIEDFYGTYAGSTSYEQNGNVELRDLNVTIEPFREGFTVRWATLTISSDEERLKKKAEYTINFQPSRRTGIFSSAMKINKFGKGVPLDPIKGDPYVWARLSGKTLTVHAMIITDDGGFEMQTYERTLTKQGLDLVFTRVRDGEETKAINAKLVRVDKY